MFVEQTSHCPSRLFKFGYKIYTTQAIDDSFRCFSLVFFRLGIGKRKKKRKAKSGDPKPTYVETNNGNLESNVTVKEKEKEKVMQRVKISWSTIKDLKQAKLNLKMKVHISSHYYIYFLIVSERKPH